MKQATYGWLTLEQNLFSGRWYKKMRFKLTRTCGKFSSIYTIPLPGINF